MSGEKLSEAELAEIARRHPRHQLPDFEPDGFAPIRSLLAEHEQLTRERDAALAREAELVRALEQIAADDCPFGDDQTRALEALAAHKKATEAIA